MVYTPEDERSREQTASLRERRQRLWPVEEEITEIIRDWNTRNPAL